MRLKTIVVIEAFRDSRRGKKHELTVVRERHKTVREAGRNKKYRRRLSAQNEALDVKILCGGLPVIDLNRGQQSCSLNNVDIFCLILVPMPRSDETLPVILNGVESLDAREIEFVYKADFAAIVYRDAAFE